MFYRRFGCAFGRARRFGLGPSRTACQAGVVILVPQEFTFAQCCVAAKGEAAPKCGRMCGGDWAGMLFGHVLSRPFAPHPALRATFSSPRGEKEAAALPRGCGSGGILLSACLEGRETRLSSRLARRRKTHLSPRLAIRKDTYPSLFLGKKNNDASFSP